MGLMQSFSLHYFLLSRKAYVSCAVSCVPRVYLYVCGSLNRSTACTARVCSRDRLLCVGGIGLLHAAGWLVASR